jgi:transitional endoplasmic reticulum ATPase
MRLLEEMKLSSKSEISLKVYWAYSKDPGNGIVRIGHDVMDLLNISHGDFVEIKTIGEERRTVARVSRLVPRDEGKGMIRIDSLIRCNLGLGTPQHRNENKDIVTVRKIDVVPAEKVVLAPVGSDSIPQIKEGYLAEYLQNMPLIKGDDVTVRYFGGVFFTDAEALVSYEGTYPMQNLILGKAITGLSAFVH